MATDDDTATAVILRAALLVTSASFPRDTEWGVGFAGFSVGRAVLIFRAHTARDQVPAGVGLEATLLTLSADARDRGARLGGLAVGHASWVLFTLEARCAGAADDLAAAAVVLCAAVRLGVAGCFGDALTRNA